MVDTGITVSAALIAGVVGSGHCFAMCGGLAGALGMRARIAGASQAATMRNLAGYQLGRIGGYTLGGALVGFFGTTLQSAVNLPKLAIGVRIASGALLALIAIRILSGWNALAVLERLGRRLWSTLQPVARHAAQRGEIGGSLLLGLVWGWLPCGLVYSMLLFAALSGSAWQGAALMLAFGIGTLPAMLSSGMLASQLQTLFRKRWPRTASGVLLFVFGVWLAIAAVNALGVDHHHQHHLAASLHRRAELIDRLHQRAGIDRFAHETAAGHRRFDGSQYGRQVASQDDARNLEIGAFA